MNEHESSLDTSQKVGAPLRRPAYVSPVLRILGDVRDVTMGASPGTGDSGNPGTQQF
jgi:hypothetical protein